MKRSGIVGPVLRGYLYADVAFRGFRVFDKNVEIFVVIKNSGVDQFEFRDVLSFSLFSVRSCSYGNSVCGYL